MPRVAGDSDSGPHHRCDGRSDGPLSIRRVLHHLDCEVLFGAGYTAHHFNDEAIGRALVKFFECQVGNTYALLSEQAIERLALPATTTAHFDTTCITLYGQYLDKPSGSFPSTGSTKMGIRNASNWSPGLSRGRMASRSRWTSVTAIWMTVSGRGTPSWAKVGASLKRRGTGGLRGGLKAGEL